MRGQAIPVIWIEPLVVGENEEIWRDEIV
ncbi:hypothetical protein GOZ98_23330 [Agrobacterium vitis]|nr:hypothetical protein [Agrobacterium vitis]